MLSLCCDKCSVLNPPPQLMAPCQDHPVTSTPALSPRTAGHPCSSHVPKGAGLAPKFLSSPCTASDHHSGIRETQPSSLLGRKWKNYLNHFRACLGLPGPYTAGLDRPAPSPLIYDPIHTELSTFFPTPQILQSRLQSSSECHCQCRSHQCGTASPGTFLQGHFYPGASP